MTLLFGAAAGLMASALLLVFGLRTGDRWIAAVAAVGSAFFVAAVSVIGAGL